MHKSLIELGLLGRDTSNEEILKAMEVGIQCNFIVTHPTYLAKINEYISQIDNPPILVCSVSHPHGLALPAVKLHEILSAVKNGARAIDYPISMAAIKNNDLDFLKREIKSATAICLDHNLIFRAVIEYSNLLDQDLLKILSILNDLDIEYLVNSTGTLVEDTLDNVLNCEFLMRHFGGRVIANGRILSLEHIRLFDDVRPWAIRVNNYQILGRILRKLVLK